MLDVKHVKARWSDNTIEVVVEGSEADFSELIGDLAVNDPTIGPLVLGEALVRLGEAPRVERVLFNGPAAVLWWDDGEKTVVKCRECADGGCRFDKGREDGLLEGLARECACAMTYDREKAVMAAMLKRLYRNYQDVLREALGVDDD